MAWQQLVADLLVRVSEVMAKALDGMTAEDLNYLPRPDCNSMGWMAWHLTRVQDSGIASLTGKEQLWVKDKWHARFHRRPDPADIGFGHTTEQVAAFKSPDSKTLLEYYNAVLEQTGSYISQLTEADLNKKLDHPVFPTVSARLIGIINDNLQHVGQIAYLRGLLKGKGWLGI